MALPEFGVDHPEFQRYVLVLNSHSTRYASGRMTPIVESLIDRFPNQVDQEIRTTNDFQNDVTRIYKKLEEGDLCLPVGGEATVKRVASALVRRHSDIDQFIVPILPIPAGNANNFANMLNKNPEDILDIIEHGKVVSWNPLLARFEIDGAVEEEIATAHVGFNISAKVSEEANSDKRRNRKMYKNDSTRLISELLIFARAVRKREHFSIDPLQAANSTDNLDLEDFEPMSLPTDLQELTIANGPKMAKLIRDLPVSLTDEQALVMHFERQPKYELPRIISYLGKRAMGHSIDTDQYMKPGDVISFRTKGNVMAHIDAEQRELAAGTNVSVSLYPQSLYGLRKSS